MARLIFMTFQARSNFNISTAVGSTRVTSSYRQLFWCEDAVDEFQKTLHIQRPLLGDTSVVLAQTHYTLGLVGYAGYERL